MINKCPGLGVLPLKPPTSQPREEVVLSVCSGEQFHELQPVTAHQKGTAEKLIWVSPWNHFFGAGILRAFDMIWLSSKAYDNLETRACTDV